MPQGMIVKALSGFYYVENGRGQVRCRARGLFRKRNVTPLVGDHVAYEAEGPEEGYILSIEHRKNMLHRPPIANVDQALLVFSVAEPDFDAQLLDRFLVHMEANRIPSVICLTKWDLAGPSLAETVSKWITVLGKAGYPVLVTSARVHRGLDDVRRCLEGRISVITGQSGVGKSSLLNSMDRSLNIDTRAISQALGRGKHTTRHVELLPVAAGGYVADTPGFSSLDFPELSPQDVESCFPEFAALRASCRFRGCTHTAEPDCAVKEAVRDGRIDQTRYTHYCLFYQEISRRKKHY